MGVCTLRWYCSVMSLNPHSCCKTQGGTLLVAILHAIRFFVAQLIHCATLHCRQPGCMRYVSILHSCCTTLPCTVACPVTCGTSLYCTADVSCSSALQTARLLALLSTDPAAGDAITAGGWIPFLSASARSADCLLGSDASRALLNCRSAAAAARAAAPIVNDTPGWVISPP